MNDFSCKQYLVLDTGLNAHKINIEKNPIHNYGIFIYFKHDISFIHLFRRFQCVFGDTESVSIDVPSKNPQQGYEANGSNV